MIHVITIWVLHQEMHNSNLLPLLAPSESFPNHFQWLMCNYSRSKSKSAGEKQSACAARIQHFVLCYPAGAKVMQEWISHPTRVGTRSHAHLYDLCLQGVRVWGCAGLRLGVCGSGWGAGAHCKYYHTGHTGLGVFQLFFVTPTYAAVIIMWLAESAAPVWVCSYD